MTNELLGKCLRNVTSEVKRSSPIVALQDPHTKKYTFLEVAGVGHRDAFKLDLASDQSDIPGECLIMLAVPKP